MFQLVYQSDKTAVIASKPLCIQSLEKNLVNSLIHSTDTQTIQIIVGKVLPEAWPMHPISGGMWLFLEVRG